MLKVGVRTIGRGFASFAHNGRVLSSTTGTSEPQTSGKRLQGVQELRRIVNSEPNAGVAWDQVWKQKVTPWVQATSAPALLELIEQNQLPGGRALVPGCGHGNDVFALAEPGKRTVIGLDISPTVIAQCEKTREERNIPKESAQFLSADFFTYAPAKSFNVIYDYTFLGALPANLHSAWASQMHKLLDDSGELVTVIFPVDGHEGGPPYAMSPEQTINLLTPLGFRCIHLRPVTKAHKGRENIEWLGRWKKSQ
ncbi:hypothetical protein CAOG_06501 [Capsaspora owczarzaki ATCC 30864]|uniref:Thiol methyltransferase 2 n=1 Tax=Capsaspora owczarzaki (strain ATCC 30864) TaxID=595528 RepID=A0A0D2WU75_CAPO3|nr:hypothetical protein CAOG_06501 [Capsaspora owczarzaki ATCC 30864]KJE96135.1 hypothetical protein CAOG_006501 [Capsaspora owczarzaki ATCC 30864]|eukprot:XP_004345250.2 hypothetical protein CAOG_06501 [Capsaspora owczarzaki ATCC 30864]